LQRFLLPYAFKWIGVVMVLCGLAGLVLYIWFDFRLMMPVFAVYSSFLETKIMSFVTTNLADELIMIILMTGFFFTAMSKEKVESADLDTLRAESFAKALWTNFVFFLLSVIFIYGVGFLSVVLLNLFTLFVFYLAFFRFSLLKR